ncbi:MAG: alanine racemase [Paracoccaceae bacterium]
MAQATLSIDRDALARNWRALDRLSSDNVETAAVVKADAYGLGADVVAQTLAEAGARTFFVAIAEEGVAVRRALGTAPRVFVFAGHMPGDAEIIAENGLIPLLNSADQFVRHRQALPGHPFGIQLDSGMNRLGIKKDVWSEHASNILAAGPALLMSHLASADDAADPMNAAQLGAFRKMTEGTVIPRSLAATDGIALGRDYHFDLTRPGIALYGGAATRGTGAVVRLSIPVIQDHWLEAGETVGYGGTWKATARTRAATVSAGYADGLLRSMSGRTALYHGDAACPVLGRVSMDLITVDVTHLPTVPDTLDILCPAQGVATLAKAAGTIPYEILTSLGPRYRRRYVRGGA